MDLFLASETCLCFSSGLKSIETFWSSYCHSCQTFRLTQTSKLLFIALPLVTPVLIGMLFVVTLDTSDERILLIWILLLLLLISRFASGWNWCIYALTKASFISFILTGLCYYHSSQKFTISLVTSVKIWHVYNPW